MPKHQRFTVYFDLTKFPGNFPGKVLVVPGIPVSREIKIQREIAGPKFCCLCCTFYDGIFIV